MDLRRRTQYVGRSSGPSKRIANRPGRPGGPSYVLLFTLITTLASAAPFRIHITDEATGRGVPLVELETVHHLRFVTDNAGNVTIDAPELMERDIYFHIRSHGYEYPADGFGYRGKKLQVEPGGSTEIQLKRLNIAERLYRITGAGLYAHSETAPIDEPNINARVFGSDSVHTAIYRNKLFWLWGDTNRQDYPLGNFHVTAATSLLPENGGLDPDIGIDLTYFQRENGFAKEMAKFPGQGPTWLSALVTLKDKDAQERLCALYVKVKPPLTVYERGLCEFDPETESFQKLFALPEDAELYPWGHPFRHGDWLYFGQAVPDLRVRNSYEDWKDPATWEAVNADAQFIDASTGDPIKNHHGCVAWNDFRQKWISIFTESGGDSSYLGEIWYAESSSPEGPWSKAVKILTHDRYSFYNPAQHPYFSKEDGRYLYFEGTHTRTFSKTEVPTPRYDYNQIMYRLDLKNPRLKPAQDDS